MPTLIDVAPPDQTSLITSMLSRLLIAAYLVACVAGQCTVCENVVKAFVETLDAKQIKDQGTVEEKLINYCSKVRHIAPTPPHAL